MATDRNQPSKVVAQCPKCGERLQPERSAQEVRCPACGMIIRARDWTIEVSGERAEDVKLVAGTVAADLTLGRHTSPWRSGSFYVVAIVVLVVLFLAVAKVVSGWLVPIVAVAAIIALTVVGAMQLRHDNRLADKSFVSLVGVALRQLPLLRSRGHDKP